MDLIKRVGCNVWLFDPTPRAVEYVNSVCGGLQQLHFQPFGLWSSKDSMRFFVPANSAHVSHSIVNLQHTEEYFEADCDNISGHMKRLGHSKIDFLKIDIEGAEHEVIRSMLGDKIYPIVICMEIDQPTSFIKTIKTIKLIESNGYILAALDLWNFTFIKLTNKQI